MNIQKYRQLLSLTQSYLLEEYTSKDWIATDQASFLFFQKYHPFHEPKKGSSAPVEPLQMAQHRPAPISRPAPIPPPAQPLAPIKQERPSLPPPPLSVPASAAAAPPPPTPAPPKKTSFTLEPLSAPEKLDFEKTEKTFRELFPHLPLIAGIPEDTEAKKIGNRWKKELFEPEIVILSFNEPLPSKTFLKNLAQAVHLHLGQAAIYPAHVIEQKNKWEDLFASKKLKLILTTDLGMYSLPKLMGFYKESPNKSVRYLGDIPVLLMTDPALYFKQPTLKFSLWRALTSLLQHPK